MKFLFNFGKDFVHFSRNPVLGTMVISVNGREIERKSSMELGTHFSIETEYRYTFPAGGSEITIEHKRPRFFGGLLPHDYLVFVDGRLVVEHTGY